MTLPLNTSVTRDTTVIVQRRLVLYLSGFDPQGPARYHRLYREQAQEQCKTSGHRIAVGTRQRIDPTREAWDIQADIEGQTCHTRYEFLRWDDIVRAHWHNGHSRYLALTALTAWRTCLDGSLWRLYRRSWVGALVCAGPMLVLLLNTLMTLLLLGLMLGTWAQTGPGVWSGLAATATAAGLWGVCRLSLHSETAWHMGWTIRSHWFTTRQGRLEIPELEARLDQHATRLLDALNEPEWDEILLVGHSSGAIMATAVAGRAAQRSPSAVAQPRLGLLTLGQCLPILSYQPTAQRFRADIRAAATAWGERWLDFTAPADRCCMALNDPAEAVQGMDGLDCPSPKVLSPRFANLFTPSTYAQRRRREQLFDMHFQYIRASELPGTYDYFAITAGPQTLAARFADQPNAKGWRGFERFGGPFPGLTQTSAVKSAD
ncbi:MAG: hypothetical protein ACR2JA_10380 [Hydrogenophaga sp.]|uniref:hypothetical protein n=1 Tax=Hydrogenophaga sp. TaxID=1904254 RepID=UPI003D9BD592